MLDILEFTRNLRMPITRKDDMAKALAATIVCACVRNNTLLEDLHADGKISDAEMKALMKDCMDNAYAMVRNFDDDILMESMIIRYSEEFLKWDDPDDEKVQAFLDAHHRRDKD